MRTVFVLARDQLGSGDRDLGQKVLATMLRKAPAAFPGLEAIVFFNQGVKLACEGSPVLVEIAQLHDAGVEILPCGTCLSHYGLQPKVGQVSDMDTILREVAAAEKVVTF
jgi:hypothetical protein